MSGLHLDETGMADVARRLLGEPNRRLSTPRELRWGRRGSLAVVPNRGVWRDHEAGVGGGVLDLVVHAGAARTRAEAARLLEGEGDVDADRHPDASQARGREEQSCSGGGAQARAWRRPCGALAAR